MEPWLAVIQSTLASYRQMIDATVVQLSDAEFVTRPTHDTNSVAVILRHLGGNLQSRWTDFLTTDGEKPDRDRDTEFLDWDGDRQSLMRHFDRGWKTLELAVESIDAHTIDNTVTIRGESHSLQQALLRSLTHITYHVGQIAMTARIVHDGEWKWLTIAPSTSDKHNKRTWGTSASRSVFAKDMDAE